MDTDLAYARVQPKGRRRASPVLVGVLAMYVAELVVLCCLGADVKTDLWMGVQLCLLLIGPVAVLGALAWHCRRRTRVERAERRATFILLCLNVLIWGMLMHLRLALAADIADVQARFGL